MQQHFSSVSSFHFFFTKKFFHSLLPSSFALRYSFAVFILLQSFCDISENFLPYIPRLMLCLRFLCHFYFVFSFIFFLTELGFRDIHPRWLSQQTCQELNYVIYNVILSEYINFSYLPLISCFLICGFIISSYSHKIFFIRIKIYYIIRYAKFV